VSRLPIGLPYFEDLGDAVVKEWARSNWDSAALASIAEDALQRSPPADHVDSGEILEWALTSELPPQPDIARQFGQPPVTVYWHPAFYIETLFWTTGTTSIHQHSFSGAFSVLEGSSLHCSYTFEEKERVNENFLIGDLDATEVSLLNLGACRRIDAGRRFIHSAFHLDCPSVTVVVRTNGDIEHQPQYRYDRPHVAINAFWTHVPSVRRVQVLRFLEETGAPDLESAVKRSLQSSDLIATYRLLDHLRQSRRCGPKFDEWLDVAAEAHGAERIARFGAVLETATIERTVRAKRHVVKKAEHRFFLGCMMNLAERQHVMSIVGSRTGEDPTSKIAQWIVELFPDASLVEAGPLVEEAVRLLLDGSSPAAAVAQCSAHREIEVPDGLVAYCHRLKSEAVLRSLL
jgi:hypothetical protein